MLKRRRGRGVRRKQQTLTWDCALTLKDGPGELAAELGHLGIRCSEGSHAVYVPPQPDLADKLGAFVSCYPEDAGYKILKNAKGPADAHYIGDLRAHAWSQSALVGTAEDLIPVANFLHEHQIAPRLYDLVQLSAGERALTAFVVQHVAGEPPSEAECEEFVGRLRHLTEAGPLVVTLPDWQRHPDFRGPDCNGNLVRSAAGGQPCYVDFQNFFLRDHVAHVEALLNGARETVHFGDRSLLRGGRYLYQQVPGWSRAGKRDTGLRWERIKALLAQAGVGVSGHVVLDVGCNMGMMMAEALNDGALWATGWDRPAVIGHTGGILSGLGYTRYNLAAAELSKDYPLPADVPPHLHHLLDESVVFYLAIRHHVGFLDALQTLPWKVMVYEEAEHRSLEQMREVLGELQGMVPCRIAGAELFEDGDCGRRPLAVLVRGRAEPTEVSRQVTCVG
jgi:hypothetical protein